jgi:predicted HAD superfamily phosphohydrolase YqeG
MQKNNIDKESASFAKISWMWSCLNGRVWKRVTARYSKFSELNIEEIESTTKKQVKWILLDVDDCIAPAYGDILEENIQKINQILDSWIKIWILSNGQNIEERIEKIQQKVWNRLEICNTGTKPSADTFIKASEQLWIDPENVIMVWDDIWIDGWALRLDKQWQTILWGFVHIHPIWNSFANIPDWKKWHYFWKKITRGTINYVNRKREK